MTIRKRLLCLMLAASMLVTILGGCKDTGNESATADVQVEYDAEAEVAKYQDYLGELTEEDKNYVIEMGYNNCDHMVASLVGQGSGIFDALGLNVNVTKTGQIMPAIRVSMVQSVQLITVLHCLWQLQTIWAVPTIW